MSDYKPDITITKDEQGWTHYWCRCGREIEHECGEINGRKMCLVCFNEAGGFGKKGA